MIPDATTKDALEYYKTVLTVQVHFNDMLLRTRSLGPTAVISLLAVAGATMSQAVARHIHLLCFDIHLAGVFAVCGLVLSLLLFALDKLYYYRLLIAAVEASEQFERDNAALFTSVGASAALSARLSACVGRRRSKYLILFFWLFPAGVCAALALAALFYWIRPSGQLEAAANAASPRYSWLLP